MFRLLTWFTTGIRPRQWVAVHRKHHAFTDVPGDPHSPVLEGYPTVQFGNVLLYRKALRDPAIVGRYARDLPPDRWDQMLFDHAVIGLGLGIVALCAVVGPWVGLLAAGLYARSPTYVLQLGDQRRRPPVSGRRRTGAPSRNNQWLASISPARCSAQQPLAAGAFHLGPPGPGQGRDRPGLVARPAARAVPLGHGAPPMAHRLKTSTAA